VQSGDVVVDVGAHVGTFGDDALRRGASKVILIEPDPVNVECIRRNFAQEIAGGRVIVVPEGAWSSRSTLKFSTGVSNSGTGSFVVQEEGSKTLSIPVRPLDDILAGLGIGKIDYIKIDIEGAEREALKGARQTLRRWRPVLMPGPLSPARRRCGAASRDFSGKRGLSRLVRPVLGGSTGAPRPFCAVRCVLPIAQRTVHEMRIAASH
jgi:FkbM family methyltransferase